MVNNLNSLVEYIQKEVVDLIGTDVSEYELKMVEDIISKPFLDIPNNRVMLSDRVQDMARLKSHINYLMYKLKDERDKIGLPYQVQYNKYFTVLTRSGRPSKAAIDAEIHHTYEGMGDTKIKLDKFDKLIDFLESQHSVVDLTIRNLESKRYEL